LKKKKLRTKKKGTVRRLRLKKKGGKTTLQRMTRPCEERLRGEEGEKGNPGRPAVSDVETVSGLKKKELATITAPQHYRASAGRRGKKRDRFRIQRSEGKEKGCNEVPTGVASEKCQIGHQATRDSWFRGSQVRSIGLGGKKKVSMDGEKKAKGVGEKPSAFYPGVGAHTKICGCYRRRGKELRKRGGKLTKRGGNRQQAFWSS